ncbi:MAG: hypothetical protein HYR63_09490 [Proteobacteria bacterium]|nr:hypothetical protein [Pseudomonadota bacterium]MBI3497546.1 hypothetical protein [Pseudomonadota bacterium]
MKQRRRGTRAAAAVVALGLAVAPVAEAVAAQCVNRPEIEARQVRLLQTELMVAALSCKHGESYEFSDHYNAFVNKFRGSLQQHAAVLKQEYRRLYGAQHESALDRFITQIANTAAERSLHQPNYCVTVRPVFEEVLTLKASDLPTYSERLAQASEASQAVCGAGKQAAQRPAG